MTPSATAFLQGLCAAAALAIGLFYWTFWRESRDRLFLYFAAAFWLMAVSWAALGLIAPDAEQAPYVYSLRLVAFLLVIVAIADKSRPPSS